MSITIIKAKNGYIVVSPVKPLKPSLDATAMSASDTMVWGNNTNTVCISLDEVFETIADIYKD